MKKMLWKMILWIVFFIPASSLAGGGNTIWDLSSRSYQKELEMPDIVFDKEEVVPILINGSVDPIYVEESQEIFRQIVKLENTIYSNIPNTLWMDYLYSDPRNNKEKEIQIEVEKIQIDFINPSYQAMENNDKEKAKSLVQEGQVVANNLLTEIEKWSKENLKKELMDDMINNEKRVNMKSDEINDLIDIANDFDINEAKISRIEKISNYYAEKALVSIEEAKGIINTDDFDSNDYFGKTMYIENYIWRLENAGDILRDSILNG